MKNLNKSYNGLEQIEVFSIKHWTKKTFSFQCIRPKNLRFRSGEFVMIGLENRDKPLLRAYSIVSPSWDENLEFYSIKVEDGPLTSRLQNLSKGDSIFLKPKSVGTLVLDALLPSKRLILFSTGTGIAPFLSVIRDPETYEKFSQVIITHTCRFQDELEYGKKIIDKINDNNLISEFVGDKLQLISTTTRENTSSMGRMTQWLQNGKFKSLTGKDLNLDTDRVMICGSLEMLQEHKKICLEKGMVEGSNSSPGHFVIEKAFVD
ncbi:MAG: ferredoxin--NADP reductase [Paracoccaceae bacterium]